MRKLMTLLVWLLLSETGFSQIVKNFAGNFKGGKAKYQYYIGTQGDTILHGDFSIVREGTKTERGKFRNNIKEGNWTYTNTDKDDFINISGNFKNDFKDGFWNFKLLNNGVEKQYLLHFRMDTLTGKIEIPGLTGEFSTDGKYIGNWTTKEEEFSFSATFKDNIVVNLTQQKTLNRSYFVEYAPDIREIVFQTLTDEYNNIVRQSYNLVGITRVLVDEFEVSKVYGVVDYNIELIDRLIYLFFDSIESNVEELFSSGWVNLKNFTLLNNPDFLYLREATKELQAAKINRIKDFEKKYGPIFDYNQVEEKPFYMGGNDKFYEFISKNYNNAATISGKIFIEIIIDFEGKLHVINTRCSGNVSCDEINRVLQICPKWQPAKLNGKTTNVRLSYPIKFQKLKKE